MVQGSGRPPIEEDATTPGISSSKGLNLFEINPLGKNMAMPLTEPGPAL